MDAVVATLTSTFGPLWLRGRTIFHETWKYFLASAAALMVDYGVMVGLTEFAHVHYLISAAFGFSAGLVVNYLLSVTVVFSQRRIADRRVEFIGFVLIGLMGLALNEGLMKLFVEAVGLGYAVAKIPATGVGFVFNFGARRLALFTKGEGADEESLEFYRQGGE